MAASSSTSTNSSNRWTREPARVCTKVMLPQRRRKAESLHGRRHPPDRRAPPRGRRRARAGGDRRRSRGSASSRRTERHRAYENCALPIAHGQTISQPLVVARMLALLALRPQDRVLDIGTGSGYHAALLARLAGRVLTVERVPELAEQARRTLAALHVDNVELYTGDGTLGLPEHGPFDAINVAAALPREMPPGLAQQLARGGPSDRPGGARASSVWSCRAKRTALPGRAGAGQIRAARAGRSAVDRLADRGGPARPRSRSRCCRRARTGDPAGGRPRRASRIRRTGPGTSRPVVRRPPRSAAGSLRASGWGSRSSPGRWWARWCETTRRWGACRGRPSRR